MKKFAFFFVTLAAFLLSCTRELEPNTGVEAPISKYLVIAADAPAMVKSDIHEGKSVWEAGDKISVLYKGTTYEYVAGAPSADGKVTYFTSSAGISNYDGSDIIAYYQALDAENGVVGLTTQRTIAFQSEGQINSACAPLVGLPTSTVLIDGILNMYFKNIFSVVELRIDPSGYHVNSVAKTLKIEPADGSEFSGYLTCSATLDPATLALTTSITGNILTLELPSGTTLRQAQTLKFPVGRFTSSKGLKLTLTLADGTVYQKDIYKTGVSTFAASNGNYSVKHLARAIFPFSGGISTAQELVDFAAAVNSGASLLEYQNSEGKVVLLDDIDMSAVTNWTPIGNGVFTGVTSGNSHESSYAGPAFKGHFDGQGFAIRNLKLSADLTTEGAVYGLFGILDGATVENVTLGADKNDNSSFAISGTGATDTGVLAGVCYGSIIRGCVNYVHMTSNGNKTSSTTASKRTTMAAFAGFVYSNPEKASLLDNLVNHGSINVTVDKNTSNGAASVMGAGIAGLADTYSQNPLGVTLSRCVNHGDMVTNGPRTSGILAAAQQHTSILSCVNYGDQTNASDNARVGMITCIMGGNTTMKDCENHGSATMTSSGTAAQVGGLVCLINDATASIIGGGNYGTILSNITTYRGLLVGNISKLNKMDGIVAGGAIGSYNGGSPQMITLTKSNYMTYIGKYSDANAAKITNIIYTGADAVGIRTASELMDFANLVNTGGDYSKYQNLSGVVTLLNDIDMSGVTNWTPIGNATHTLSSNVLTLTGNAFTGHFNGNGHTIKNLDMVCKNSVAGAAYGLFGALGSGAVVENLVMDATSSLKVQASAQTISGVVAGIVYDAQVKDIVNNASMQYISGATDARTTLATVGIAFAQNNEVLLENITNNAAVTAEAGGSTLNNGNAVHVAGVLGFGTNHVDSANKVLVKGCVNQGAVTSATGRAAGLVCAMNRYTVIEDCVNKGNVTNSFATASSGRIGGITVIAAAGCQIINTVNNADVISTNKGGVGAVACLINSSDVVVKNVESYGRVITDNTGYRGTFFGQCNVAAIFSNCISQADLGSYNKGSYKMVGANASNWFDYVGIVGQSAVYATPLNIRWDNASQVAPAFPAQWEFSAQTRPMYESSWQNFYRIPSTSSSPATISVVRAPVNAGKAFTCVADDGSGTSKRPYVGNLLKDDYWLWTFPVQYVPAGSYVLFNVTMSGGQDSPKYYILEYFDEGEWKQANLLRTIPEDNTLKYSFRIFGVQNGGKYQHATFTHVLQLKGEILNSSLQIRCRVPVDVSCSGGKLSLDSADGTCSIAPMGFTGSYVTIMGNKAPKDTKRVLCIGNSFSHYGDPSWKLVEIAFAEGHKIEMFGHFKGSQTFEDHLALELTTVAINMGKFHYAFIQDQSSAHANYASDATTYKSTLTNSQALKDKIIAKVSTCKVVLENTWSFPASSYGGFTSYENFDNLLLTGTKSIAQSIGSQVSPIGQAFKKVRADYPQIQLYDDDNKHQSPYGAYLKACVNYLVMYGEPFGDSPADCGLNPTHTALLRKAAEAVVLGHESDYYITR
jgi:hypothetical protein